MFRLSSDIFFLWMTAVRPIRDSRSRRQQIGRCCCWPQVTCRLEQTMAEFTAQTSHFCFQSTEREMVEKDRVEVLLEEVSHIEDAVSVDLSNKSFSEDAAALIGAKLQTFASLKRANFSDIIAGRMEEEALMALQKLCEPLKDTKFVELNLSDNALGRPGIDACRAVLSGNLLESLKVCNCGLSAEAASLLAEVLSGGGMPPLSTFHFYNNMSGDNGALAIAIIVSLSPDLEDLRFSATRSMKPGCTAVAESLQKLTKLRKLDVSDSSFGEGASVIMADAIGKNPNLTHINLRDANLEAQGAIAIFRSICSAGLKVEYLDVSGNDINADVLQAFSENSSSLSELRELYLDDNEITSDGTEILGPLLRKFTNLRILSLISCEITAAGAYRIAKAVSKIPSFESLRFDGNEISERGVLKIREVLSLSGKTLGDMEDNDEEADDDLDDAMEEEEEDEEEGDIENSASPAVDELVAGIAAARI